MTSQSESCFLCCSVKILDWLRPRPVPPSLVSFHRPGTGPGAAMWPRPGVRWFRWSWRSFTRVGKIRASKFTSSAVSSHMKSHQGVFEAMRLFWPVPDGSDPCVNSFRPTGCSAVSIPPCCPRENVNLRSKVEAEKGGAWLRGALPFVGFGDVIPAVSVELLLLLLLEVPLKETSLEDTDGQSNPAVLPWIPYLCDEL